jgi:uncharacterized protein (DUF983 family)
MSLTPSLPPDRLTALRRGTRGHCPRCDGAEVFRSTFRLHERCPRCGLPLEMEDGWSYGSVPLAYLLACLVWVLPVALLALFDLIPLTAAVVLGLAGVILLPVLTFRFTKKLWIGLYYALIPREMRYRGENERGDTH